MQVTKSPIKRLLFLIALFWFAQYIFNPFFSSYLEELQIASTLIGTIVGIYGFSQLMLRIPFGMLADRLENHKLLIGIGFVSILAAGTVLSLVNTPALFLLGRFLSGVASSTWVSFTGLLSGFFSEKERGKSISLAMMANNFGTLLAYTFGMLFYDYIGIRPLFVISAVCGIVGLFVLLSIDYTGVFGETPMRFSQLGQVLRDKTLLLHSFLALVIHFVIFATALSFTGNYAMELGASGFQLGLLSICYGAGGFLGAAFWGSFLGHRLSPRFQYTVSFLLFGMYAFWVPRFTHILPLLLIQIGAGFTANHIITMAMSISPVTIPEHLRATAVGTFQSLYGFGIALGPIVMGFLLERGATNRPAFTVIALICVVGSLVSLLWVRPVVELE